MPGFVKPAPLGPGARIAVVAPSGPYDTELLARGVARLAEQTGFEIHVPEAQRGRRSGYFAGDDETRLAELDDALRTPNVDAILLARGGYGIGRLLPRLDLTPLVERPRWFIGFSDGTALHLALARAGLMSVHGPNATTIADASAADLEMLVRLLTEEAPAQEISGLDCWVPGAATGGLVGGNLTVLFTEAAAGTLSLPEGCILFLEDVTETSYRVDRMLDALVRGGHFDRVRGLVFGEFTDCSPGKFHVPVHQVLSAAAERIGVPSICGFPAGHGAQQRPFVHGGSAALDAARGALSFG